MDQTAVDRRHASPMMQKISELRDKYGLHMTVERYKSDNMGLPESDRQFIRIQEDTIMSERIVQTAGREQLGEFAPDFAHFNDDILFGENWTIGISTLKHAASSQSLHLCRRA